MDFVRNIPNNRPSSMTSLEIVKLYLSLEESINTLKSLATSGNLLFQYQDCPLVKMMKINNRVILSTFSSPDFGSKYIMVDDKEIKIRDYFNNFHYHFNFFDKDIEDSKLIHYFRLVNEQYNTYSSFPYPSTIIYLGCCDMGSDKLVPLKPSRFILESSPDQEHPRNIPHIPDNISLEHAIAILTGNYKNSYRGTGGIIGIHGDCGNIQIVPPCYIEKIKIRCSIDEVGKLFPPIPRVIEGFYRFINYMFDKNYYPYEKILKYIERDVFTKLQEIKTFNERQTFAVYLASMIYNDNLSSRDYFSSKDKILNIFCRNEKLFSRYIRNPLTVKPLFITELIKKFDKNNQKDYSQGSKSHINDLEELSKFIRSNITVDEFTKLLFNNVLPDMAMY